MNPLDRTLPVIMLKDRLVKALSLPSHERRCALVHHVFYTHVNRYEGLLGNRLCRIFLEQGASPLQARQDEAENFPRRCRACGCTDDDCSQCIEKTGQPCFWVEANLCSACVAGPEGRPEE